MLETLPFFALFAPFILFWNQSKNFLIRVLNCFWKTKELDQALSVMFYRAISKYPCYSFDNYNVSTDTGYKNGEREQVLFRSNFVEIFFWKNFIPILIKNRGGFYSISYFNLTFPFKKFLINIFNNEKSLGTERKTYHQIHIIRGKGKGIVVQNENSGQSGLDGSRKEMRIFLFMDCVGNKLGKLMDGTAMSEFSWNAPNNKSKYTYSKQGQEIKKIVEKWNSSEDWYFSHGIRYYYGVMLEGGPGNGKSSLIFEISKDLQLPIFIVDLSSFENEDFCNELDKIQNSKGIVVFEDLDCVFNGRDNITKTELFKGITFDCFINKLSGTGALKNKFVFGTTNKLSLLDPALIRPGRFDKVVHFLPIDKETKEIVCKKILGHVCEKLVNDQNLDTTAKFEAACIEKALTEFWNGEKVE